MACAIRGESRLSEMTSKRDWMIVCLIAAGVTILLSVPYVLGYAFARPGTEFTGIIMNPEDSQSYFAKMLEGYDGQWLYTIPFTTEAHAPAFVGGFYLALGHLARGLNLSLVAVWHIARIVFDWLMFVAVFGFIATFLRDSRTRWTAYLLAIFGSGLGWVLFLLDQPYWLDFFPVDFKMPEAHLFFSALTFPHVTFGITMILASLWLSFCFFATPSKWLYVIGAGVANLLLAIAYPFLIYLIAATLGIYWLILQVQARRILWREAILSALTFIPVTPLLLYYAFTLKNNPVFNLWDAQSITLSPPVPHYLIAYGVMLLLAALSLRQHRSDLTFLWAWVIAAALLIYAPLNAQRRFVEGVQVPLSILATIGLLQVFLPWLVQTRFYRWLVSHPRYTAAGVERLFIVLFLFLMSLSNGYVLASVSVTAAIQQPFPLFRTTDEIQAVDWLRANTSRSDVVMGAYETGNFVAARAGNRVVIGHWAETVDWKDKFDETERFYTDATGDEWRSTFLLNDYHVAFVFWGATERSLGDFNPEHASYLEKVFSNDTTRIYRVRNQMLAGVHE